MSGMHRVFLDQIGGSISPSLASRLSGSVFGSKPASQTQTDNDVHPRSRWVISANNRRVPQKLLARENVCNSSVSAAHRFGSDWSRAVVEPTPSDDSFNEPTARALHQRIRQQELLAELGVLALQRTSFIDMLDQTARMTAEGLEAEYCKVMEYIPAENRLLVRAGVGWGEGVVGAASVGADFESPAGYALRTGNPVISNHLENEQRFRTPELLVKHGIRRAMNVILQGDGSPFGVLEVDSKSEGEFGERDIAFLQGAANILGMAIEQQQYQRKLQAGLDRHQVLLKEVNHRVKNSLQAVSAMLQLQANAADDQALGEQLNEAASRVNAVGRAYERLAYNADYEKSI
jgi:hypothetical protein